MPTLPFDCLMFFTSQSMVSQASVVSSVLVGLSEPIGGRVMMYLPSEPYLPRTSCQTRMVLPSAQSLSPDHTASAMRGLLLVTKPLALYGVRSSSIGRSCAPFGISSTVCSFTPSRIGIITSRLT